MKKALTVQTAKMDLPDNVKAGGWQFTVDGDQVQTTDGPAAVYDLKPGAHVVTVQRLTSDGAPLFAAVVQSFDVVAEQADAPVSISIEVA